MTDAREVGALPLPLGGGAVRARARQRPLEAAAEAAALRAEVDAAMPNPLRDFARRADDLLDAAARRFDEMLRAPTAACGAAARLGDVRASRWHAAGSARLRRELDAAQLSLLRAHVPSPRCAATPLAPSTPSSPTPSPPSATTAAPPRGAPPRDVRLRAPRARREPAATAALPASLALPAAEARLLAAELSAAAELHEAEAEALPPLPGDDQPPPWWKQILQQLIVAAIQMRLHVAAASNTRCGRRRARRGERSGDGGEFEAAP